ncbi:hypothetical protein J4411_00125 [Candidatus Pacearchaeota archaeon]|nr:hypothetical protein [uncultured archaeon]MBS3084306.1 hypothetical protein [Candidatus Pacearchaeota archaeon]
MKIYRYTTKGEGVFSAGRRLMPKELTDEVLENKKWLVKPELTEGVYLFYLTEKGREEYEKKLLNSHKKYLTDIKLETHEKENLKKIVYEDEYQIVEKLK